MILKALSCREFLKYAGVVTIGLSGISHEVFAKTSKKSNILFISVARLDLGAIEIIELVSKYFKEQR